MPPDQSSPCILLVEPDILVRHPLAEYLRACGFRVCEALAAIEAKTLLQDPEFTVDIVLIDAAGNGGFALANWIRAHHRQIQVLLAGTVSKALEKASDLCEEGPAIEKPYDHKHVLAQIKRLLAARMKL